MMARLPFKVALFSLLCLILPGCLLPPHVSRNSPPGLLMTSVDCVADVIEENELRTFHARFKITEADGISKKFLDQEIAISIQPPDRLQIAAYISGKNLQLGRNGQQLWIYAVDKRFCLVGEPDVPAFEPIASDAMATPAAHVTMRPSASSLGPLELPVSRFKLSYLPRYLKVTRQPDQLVGTNLCYVLKVVGTPEAVEQKRIPKGQISLWLDPATRLPLRLTYSNDRGTRVTLEAQELAFERPWPRERWAFVPSAGDQVKIVALSHLTGFIKSRLTTLTQKIPSLGPATGEREVLATAGQGRLELIDGTRVLFVKGSPEEMGYQHGTLLKKKIRTTMRHVLYGVGVGSSLANGAWFFDEMAEAQKRLLPYMDPRYLREMDAMADAAGVTREELRMANMFPELFHCSGFALYGDATVGGRMYHGRILDYFRGQGLEQNAVVIVSQPDYGHAWVNVSYAGFVGSVTAMNEMHVAIGEMGGRGEGNWDGKPMAQLVREVMEKADTIDEAVEIMRTSPRTCEYYYVISDAKSHRAVAIRATPTEFETAWAGETHPLIPEAIKDVVAISGGDRFTALLARIRAGYGKFDADSARDLMTRPVCMPSNIHSVLFAPDTLDFWVANSDSKNVASNTRYTHYNLLELSGRIPEPVARASR